MESLEWPEFANSLGRIIQKSVSLAEDLMKEVKEHVTRWKKRHGSYKRVFEGAFAVNATSKALLSGETQPTKFLPKETIPELAEMPE